jgi:serine/threonine protein kinase
MSLAARTGAAASAAVVKRLAVLSWYSGEAEPVPSYAAKFASLNHGFVGRPHPLVPDTLTLHLPFVAHRTARFSLTLYVTDMTEPITPKPGTPGTGRGGPANEVPARPAGQSSDHSPSHSSGHRDTVLLSDVPDAATVVTEDAASSAAATSSLSPAAIAALGVRYGILGEAGHGSMGNVYKARDRETGETVALKLLKPEIASDQAMMDRFKNELLFARKITHKNVCRVYEFNRVAGIAYTSMEFVEGESLRSVLNRFGGLPQRKATDLALQICSGLKEAHAQGIVHRDLKPENVMIDGQGNVKIMDFGIARSMEAGTRLTGSMVGTPAYMAPEQVAGKPVDYRTDIYSLGLMLYEMFTGVPAFSADNSIAVALKQMREDPPPPHEIEPNIPVGTERTILKCLEKDPAKRFQSIADLETNFRSGAPVMPPPRMLGTTTTNLTHNSTGVPRAATAAATPSSKAAISQPAPRRTSPFVWILLGAMLVVGALSALHWLGVVQAANKLSPPTAATPPKPPEFAYEHPAPPPVAPVVAETKLPAAKIVAHARPPAPEPAKPAAPDVFPRMETGPVRKNFRAGGANSAKAPGSNPVITNSMYVWVGRFEREDKAQAAAKKVEDLQLPASIVPKSLGSIKYYAVFCGPIDSKRVGAVSERLEAKGFSNVRPVSTPFAGSKQKE